MNKQLTAPSAASPCLWPALLTGALLWCCYFPLAWGWLAWIALAPLLTLVRAQGRSRRVYWSAYAGGLAFFVPVLQWMRVADYRMYFTWLALAFYCAAYFPAAIYLIRLLERRTRLPLCLSAAIVITGLEWVRSFLMTGFAWYFLGHTQHRFSSLIQIADLGGVYAISFLIAGVNGWLADLPHQIPALRDRFRWMEPRVAPSPGSIARWGLWVEGAVLAGGLAFAVAYGMSRLDHAPFQAGPRVALLQGNLDQRIKNAATADNPNVSFWRTMTEHYMSLSYLSTMNTPLADLVVWPETSYHARWIALSPRLPMENTPRDYIQSAQIANQFMEDTVKTVPTTHLLGTHTHQVDDEARATSHSSALLVPRDGRPTHRYDKMHRVPFGEYVPLVDWFSFMKVLAPYEQDYSIKPGTTFTRFPLGPWKFGALICYEDSDPYLARRYVRDEVDGKPVDFLVNIANDGWFDGTSEHEEHLVVSRFRAIECRRALLRAVNMGVSAVIDGDGRVLKPTPMPVVPDPNMKAEFRAMLRPFKIWEVVPKFGQTEELPVSEYAEYKKVGGVLIANVPMDRRESFYAAWGDLLPIGCWGLLVASIGWSVIRRKVGNPSSNC